MKRLTALSALAAVTFSLHPASSQEMENGDFFSRFEGRTALDQVSAEQPVDSSAKPAAVVEAKTSSAEAVDPVETGSVKVVKTTPPKEESEEVKASTGLAAEHGRSPDLVAVSRAGKSKMVKLPGVQQPSFGVESKATEVEVVKGVTAATTSGPKYSTIVSRYAASYGVPLSLAHAVIRVESNYRSDARGSAGEIGLMQIKPATARMLGYSGSTKGLYDPDTNIRYGMKYLAMAQDLSDGSTCGTILKYNAGHGAKRMNPISAAYCSKVKRLLSN